MNEYKLTNEELVHALLEYLKNKLKGNDLLLDEINYKSLIKDNYNLTNEINEINHVYDYKINKLNNINNIYDYNDYSNDKREVHKILSLDTAPKDINEEKSRFLQNSKAILEDNSHHYLKRDPEIIIASIKRDINSIVCAYNESINNEIRKQSILEAKRQGYIFSKNTPLFMLQNLDLIKQSAERDINTINYVNDDVCNREISEFVIELAKEKGYILSSNSPVFLRSNVEVIKQSIKKDKNSFSYIIWRNLQPEELEGIEKYIIENQLDFIVKFDTPINFKRNVDICIKSAKNDSDSLRYFDWNFLKNKQEQLERIYEALEEQKYVLNFNSPYILKNNVRIGLSSIKQDLNSARYLSQNIQNWLIGDLDKFPIETEEDSKFKTGICEIRKYLLNNDFYTLNQLFNFPIYLLKDEFVLEYYLKQMGISDKREENKIYYDRIKDFIKNTISAPLKVSDVRKVFQFVAQKKWDEYRRKNYDYYTNIFNRICDALEKNNNFISALNELKFLMKVDEVLDDRKYELFNSFIEYHQIYHSQIEKNKIELLQEKRESISQNAALFISKSKEDFISEQVALFDELYKDFFIIRVDNPIVKKKVVEVKQRDMLKKMFNSKDAELIEKIDIIKNKYLVYNYNSSINKAKVSQILDLFVSKIINDNVSSIDDILSSSKPERFDEYENYEKVSKLINRLNSHNITFDGKEVNKYRDFILYDGEKYIYKGNGFSNVELSQIMGYKDLKYVFSKIRSEIIQIAKSIDEFDKLTQDDIREVIGECPFREDYYHFNTDIFDKVSLNNLNDYINIFEENKDILLNEENYRAVQKLVSESGIIKLSMIGKLQESTEEIRNYVSSNKLVNTLGNISNLMTLLTLEEFNIDNLDKILEFNEMFKYANLKQISLLGKDVLKKIYSNNGFTVSSQSERINVACDLVSAMVSRNESTVPYINGSYRNYKYSMYDSTDVTLLTTGLDTNACFRCCGNDNDFLHYCALDKNGFVIKITDSKDNFIGRASGFRNGNGVYINQLRTIYDKKSSAYSSEKEAIIKTFEHACSDIVEISQNNQNEETKIDFVVVTKSYTLDDSKTNVNDMTTTKIGKNPMETESEDWKQFINNTNNLIESVTNDYFYTDFGNYNLICMKSAVGELTPEKIKNGDVKALYHRNRKKVSINEYSENTENHVNRIRACYSHQTDTEFSYLKITKESKIATGDNWYIIFGNQGLIDSCYLSNDKYAELEFNTVIGQLMLDQQNVQDMPSPKSIR